MRQLQNRGASNSRFGKISEAEVQKQLKENPQILENIAKELYGQKIDARKEAALIFPSNGKTVFHSYINKISARLNAVLERKDGQLFEPPIMDLIQGPSLSPVH